jgi:hypothetical protein
MGASKRSRGMGRAVCDERPVSDPVSDPVIADNGGAVTSSGGGGGGLKRVAGCRCSACRGLVRKCTGVKCQRHRQRRDVGGLSDPHNPRIQPCGSRIPDTVLWADPASASRGASGARTLKQTVRWGNASEEQAEALRGMSQMQVHGMSQGTVQRVLANLANVRVNFGRAALDPSVFATLAFLLIQRFLALPRCGIRRTTRCFTNLWFMLFGCAIQWRRCFSRGRGASSCAARPPTG